jgi:hypothetical protein
MLGIGQDELSQEEVTVPEESPEGVVVDGW